ncbi:MAG: GNAT family N-acetyltransferase, partial [Promethearchaeota archaeon]
HYIWKIILKNGIKLGEVYTTSENLEGIAVWHPPERVNISYWKYFLNGGFFLPFRFGINSTKKIMYIQDVNVSMRIHLMKTPYWYLGPIGVDPAHQGKGFASKLITPMLDRIFWENLPILLETNARKNVSIYEHFGFEVIEEIIIPKTNFISWIMIKND